MRYFDIDDELLLPVVDDGSSVLVLCQLVHFIEPVGCHIEHKGNTDQKHGAETAGPERVHGDAAREFHPILLTI